MFFFGSKRWLFKLWKVRWVFKDLRRRGGNNEKNVYQSTAFLWWKGLQSTWTRQLYQTMQQYTMLKWGKTPLVSHYVLLYSWRFHWLVHGHMTSNNETVSRQVPWRQRETVHCYPRNVERCCTWSEVAWCCHWYLSAFSTICFCFVLFLLYNKCH